MAAEMILPFLLGWISNFHFDGRAKNGFWQLALVEKSVRPKTTFTGFQSDGLWSSIAPEAPVTPAAFSPPILR